MVLYARMVSERIQDPHRGHENILVDLRTSRENQNVLVDLRSVQARRPASMPPAPHIDRGPEVLLSDPIRALIYLAALQEPDAPHTYSTLCARLNDLQGDNPGWAIQPRKYDPVRFHADRTMVPVGLLEVGITQHHGRAPARTLRAMPTPERTAWAAAGIDWELQFRDDRLADLLGTLTLGNTLSSPLSRLGIFGKLIDARDGGLTSTMLATQLEQPSRRIGEVLRTCREADVLDWSPRLAFEERIITLTRPAVDYHYYGARALGQTGQALLDITKSLLEKGEQRNIAGGELVRLVLAKYPSLDADAIKDALTRNMPSFVQPADTAQDEKTGVYTIPSRLMPSISDLILRYRLLQNDPAFAAHAVTRAQEIMADEESVAFLMSKAKPRAAEEWRQAEINRRRHLKSVVQIGSLTLQRLPIVKGWREKQACTEADSDLFFPTSDSGPSQDETELAKSICAACKVRPSCLQWSLDTGQQHGIAGGMTADERRAYRRKPHVKGFEKPSDKPLTNRLLSARLEGRALASKSKN